MASGERAEPCARRGLEHQRGRCLPAATIRHEARYYPEDYIEDLLRFAIRSFRKAYYCRAGVSAPAVSVPAGKSRLDRGVSWDHIQKVSVNRNLSVKYLRRPINTGSRPLTMISGDRGGAQLPVRHMQSICIEACACGCSSLRARQHCAVPSDSHTSALRAFRGLASPASAI